MAVDTTLQSEFQELARKLLHEDFASLMETVTYDAITQTYNPATGETAETVTTSVANVPAFFEDFPFSRVDGVTILQQDRTATIAFIDLPGLTPKEHDRLTLANGQTCRVHAKQQPGKATYVLQVR